jgi:hypothetical protein
MPPPVFLTLPIVEELEPTPDPSVYRVTLREAGGEPKSALFSVTGSGAHTDWDIFWRWPGDAESLRSIVRQVCDYHRTRE